MKSQSTARDGQVAAMRETLQAIGACRHEAELLRTTAGAVTQLAGADHATLVTRRRNRASWPFGRVAPELPRIGEVSPALERHLMVGEPVVLRAPGLAGTGLDCPEGTELIGVLPCAGAESHHALILTWATRREIDLEDLSMVALVCGLTIDRIDAVRGENRRTAEVENRIRNVIALVRSVSTRSAERSESLEEFVMHFDGRVGALGRAQLALARSGTHRVDFEMLLREELLAQGVTDGPQISLQGMPIGLRRTEAEVLLLGVHELAVNAVKFGALSCDSGRMTIRWWVEQADGELAFHLKWREDGMFGLEPPSHVGFGRTILERAIPYELDGTTRLQFRPCGLLCEIIVPLSSRSPMRYLGFRTMED